MKRKLLSAEAAPGSQGNSRSKNNKKNGTVAPSSKKSKPTPPTQKPAPAPATATTASQPLPNLTLQIITGSYDRILHGITVSLTLRPSSSSTCTFSDTFLFTAHSSSIRCLALSPPSSSSSSSSSQKLLLATGSTDQRINLYHISAHPPRAPAISLPTLTRRPILENKANRELGSLLHHSATVTALHFATRAKLLSAGEDSRIVVTRTRDWAPLSEIKVPVPKEAMVGRPSGDTVGAEGVPRGVNGVAVHRSLKIMITVARGEKAMRLWNLVTGKKAGVLQFERCVLAEVGEGKYSTGEGSGVVWGVRDGGKGEEFAVVFERGVLVFGMDCIVRCKALPPGEAGASMRTRTKVHRVRYVEVAEEDCVLAVSTEDGRVVFYSTREGDLVHGGEGEGDKEHEPSSLPAAKVIGELGGKAGGVEGRIKDFVVLRPDGGRDLLVVTGSSDGAVRVWKVGLAELAAQDKDRRGQEQRQIGSLLGSYATGNRITCMDGFIMIPLPEGADDDAEDVYVEEEEERSERSDEESE